MQLAFDPKAFQKFIEHDSYETRELLKELGKDPLFVPKYNIPLADQRTLSNERLSKAVKLKTVSIKDFRSNIQNVISAHEVLAYIDPSAAVKFTSHINLFGGSLFELSTDRHQSLLPKVDDFSIVGCFCLTELGYGNNVFELQTTATYDHATKEFIINSPTPLSQKYLAANTGCHANYGIITAQTVVNGVNEGIHAFLVRLRDENHNTCEGIFISDLGMKMELSGIDNASITFRNVRVPYTSLLNKFSDVDPKTGIFSSSIPNKRSRFQRIAEKLIPGRLCIAATCLGACKLGIVISLKYAKNRYGVGPDGKSSMPIFEYQLQKLALIPLLSQIVCFSVVLNGIKDTYIDPKVSNEEKIRICCVIKALITWFGAEAGSVIRERCGGQGYLGVNRIGSIFGMSHAAITGEGDNVVLMQKISKELLTDLRSGKYILPESRKKNNELCGNIDFQSLSDLRDLLIAREVRTVVELQETLVGGLKNGKSIFQIWMTENSNLVQKTAKAYGERIMIDYCFKSLGQIGAESNKELLNCLYCLSALIFIQKDLAWFVVSGLMNNNEAESIENRINELVNTIAPVAVSVAEHLGVPEHLLRSPIASDYIKYNEIENKGEYIEIPKL